MYKFVIFILYLLGEPYYKICLRKYHISLIHFASGQWIQPKQLMEHHDLLWRSHSNGRFQLPPNHNFIRGRGIRRPLAPPISTTTKAPVINGKRNDPCAPYDPPLPNFRTPGRRISEVKCFEYIWQLKIREDKAQRRQDCDMSRSDHLVLNVVEGHITSRGQYPNMGAIGWKAVVGSWKFLCACSLISAKFVLTAAHCSSVSERDTTVTDVVPKVVRLGDKNIAGEEDAPNIEYVDVAIIKIIVHPKYKSPMQYYDIALMELGREMTFSMDIHPACLWTRNNFSLSMQAEVSGWGATTSGSKNTSPELLAAEVDVIDSVECDSLLQHTYNRNWYGLEDHQLCAGKLGGGADACQGDSGGPLSIKIPLPITTQGNMHFILGVTSFGAGCGLSGLPGVYTRVSSFVDWIENIVWPGS